MINNEVRSNIQKYGQEHLLKYYDTLSTKERSIYDEQLNNLNFGYLDINRENKNEKKETHYEPIRPSEKMISIKIENSLRKLELMQLRIVKSVLCY